MLPGVNNNNNMNSTHPLIPVGLYISSAICKEMFGKISRDDINHFLLYAKESFLNKSPSRLLEGVKKDLPKVIAPALYLTSLLISVQNTEKSRQYHQFLKQSVDGINKKTTSMEKDVHETNTLIKEMVKK
jgi:hypothetical protein